MKTIGLLSVGVATLLGVLLPAPSAHAIPRTFVSGTGSGTTCTRAAPCATFQAAHDATDAGGEINCVDAGNFGAVTISKPITIDCTGTLGWISGTGNGNSVTVSTGGVVRLRNLTLNGLGSQSATGIELGSPGTLFVENCTIANYTFAGISVDPAVGTAKLFVSDSVISNSGDGINLTPDGSARVVIDGVRAEKSAVEAISQLRRVGTAGQIVVQVRNSVLTGSAFNGIGLFTGSGPSTTSVTVDRSSLTLNRDSGVRTSSSDDFVLLGRSTVISNATGLNASGGSIFSYQNNHLTGNVTDGAPTATLSVK